MIEPLSADTLDELRRIHTPYPFEPWNDPAYCVGCAIKMHVPAAYPCVISLLVAELDRRGEEQA